MPNPVLDNFRCPNPEALFIMTLLILWGHDISGSARLSWARLAFHNNIYLFIYFNFFFFNELIIQMDLATDFDIKIIIRLTTNNHDLILLTGAKKIRETGFNTTDNENLKIIIKICQYEFFFC